MADSNLLKRVAFAAVAIPVALAVVYVGGLPLVALLALVGALGARELFDFAARQGIQPVRPFGLLAAAAFAPLAYVAASGREVGESLRETWGYWAALWLIALLSWVLWLRKPSDKPLETVAVTVFGSLYAGALPAFLIGIRHGDGGGDRWASTWLVFFPLVITWVCDTAAMFGGRALGGPKLAPTVSPGKTWSGSITGLIGALMVVPVYQYLVFDRVGVALPLWYGLLFAAVLSVVGQIGDLAESLLKRQAGLKDSSPLIPGHGGVLDRFDSLYFVVPVAAALYHVFGL